MEPVFQPQLHLQESHQQVPQPGKQGRAYHSHQLPEHPHLQTSIEQPVWVDHQPVYRLVSEDQSVQAPECD